MTHAENNPLTHSELAIFTGDLERFRHSMIRTVIYTPGVQYLAQRGGAYWLIDEIAFAIAGGKISRAGRHDSRVLDLHFWKLVVKADQSAVLTARVDNGVRPFVRQTIDYTDFPLDEIEIWAAFDGEHWTLYLPSEH